MIIARLQEGNPWVIAKKKRKRKRLVIIILLYRKLFYILTSHCIHNAQRPYNFVLMLFVKYLPRASRSGYAFTVYLPIFEYINICIHISYNICIFSAWYLMRSHTQNCQNSTAHKSYIVWLCFWISDSSVQCLFAFDFDWWGFKRTAHYCIHHFENNK